MPKYVVTNGIKYLRQSKTGRYSLVSETDATVWKTFKQALNALNNGISKCARDRFFVEKTSASKNPKDELQKLIETDTSNFNRWLSSIGNFKKFVNTINYEKHYLIAELESIEQEICDIRHYIEFGKLNAYQGWTAYEMLKTTLVQRRKVKDTLYIIDGVQFRKHGISEVEGARIAIDNLNARVYTPRKLSFLFESCGKIECEVCFAK